MPGPEPSSPGVQARMASQRRRDTSPELAVRRILHARGLRYRVDHPLPGMPRRRADLYFGVARVAVFVDGCFWHACPEHGTSPRNNETWWAEKLRRNVERDLETDRRLRDEGWIAVRIWEHENPQDAANRVQAVVTARRAQSARGAPSWLAE